MIIDGEKIARQIEAKLKVPRPAPGLAILVLDDDRAGQVYTRLKKEASQRLGIKVVVSNDPKILAVWGADPAINGILIQFPGWRGREFYQKWQSWVTKIPQNKDVDGLRPDSPFIPATVKAIQRLMPASGKILVVGRGMVGRAAAGRLKAENISSHDPQLNAKVLAADILITACGCPGLIKAVKIGATVIDAGWPKGDVDFEAVKNIAGAITPVPGGLGPMTVVCLLENLTQAV